MSTLNFVEMTEEVLLSLKLIKFNKYNWQQERRFIISKDNIYNFKKKSNLLEY